MQFVNKPGGYLAVKELRTLRRWHSVPKEQEFALPSTLKDVAKQMDSPAHVRFRLRPGR